MKKPRKHHSAAKKVAILGRHLVERVPASDLCDHYHPAIDVLQHADQQMKVSASANAIF